MARFRQVYTEFWDDGRVIEEMTPEDKLFMVYLLTNPLTTQIGVYQITKKQMAFHLGYSIESINSLMDRFEKHHQLIKYNTETREIAIKNWGKYNFIRGGKPVYDLIKSELKEVKDVELVQWVYLNYLDKRDLNEGICKIFNTFLEIDDADTSRDTIRGQEEDVEEDKEKEKDIDIEEDVEDIDSTTAPYKEIQNLFNSTCISFTAIITLSEKRKEQIQARFEQYGNDITIFKKLFEKTENSKFLKGENKDNWQANFDWLMKEDSMAKVLEGRYDKLKDIKKQTNSDDIKPYKKTAFHNFDQRTANYTPEELERMILEKQKKRYGK